MDKPKFSMTLEEFNLFRDTYEEIHGKNYKIFAPQDAGIAGYGILEAIEVEKRLFEANNNILITKMGFRTTDKRRFFAENVVFCGFNDVNRDRQGSIIKAKILITTRDDEFDPLNDDELSIFKDFTFLVHR